MAESKVHCGRRRPRRAEVTQPRAFPTATRDSRRPSTINSLALRLLLYRPKTCEKMMCPSISLLLLPLLLLNCLALPAKEQAKQNGQFSQGNDDDAKAVEAAGGKEQPAADAKMRSPPQFPEIPPQLEKVLPADVVQKLKTIHVDPSLSFLDKQEKIDKIMTSLPVEILDKIPAPPGFDRLPVEVRNKLKQIHRNKDKTWTQKQQDLQAYIQSLPADQRAMLMMGPMGGPPPPMGPPPSFGGRP